MLQSLLLTENTSQSQGFVYSRSKQTCSEILNSCVLVISPAPAVLLGDHGQQLWVPRPHRGPDPG